MVITLPMLLLASHHSVPSLALTQLGQPYKPYLNLIAYHITLLPPLALYSLTFQPLTLTP